MFGRGIHEQPTSSIGGILVRPRQLIRDLRRPRTHAREKVILLRIVTPVVSRVRWDFDQQWSRDQRI